MIRALLALAALLYSIEATPEQNSAEWWQPWNFGAPCTTKTDRAEGTCVIEVKREPHWR